MTHLVILRVCLSNISKLDNMQILNDTTLLLLFIYVRSQISI